MVEHNPNSLNQKEGSLVALYRNPNSRKWPLDDFEFGDLLSAVGNHEGKGLLLAAMEGNIIYGRSELHKIILDAQSEVGWRISSGLPIKWCKHSLSPIGLVAEEVQGRWNTVGFMRTDYGNVVGVPFAGLLLKTSNESPYSLYQLFGRTTKSSRDEEQSTEILSLTSPFVRAAIFYELITAKLPITQAHLLDNLNERYRQIGIDFEGFILTNHLQSLARSDIIQYDSASNHDEVYSFYTLSPNAPYEPPPPFQSRPTFTNKIFEALKQLPGKSRSIEEIINNLGIISSRDRQRVSSVLKHLAKKGYLQHEGKYNEEMSSINLTTEQQRLLTQIILALDNFKSGDERTLQEGRDFAHRVRIAPDLAADLMLKAKLNSPSANAWTREEALIATKSVLIDHGESTWSEIVDFLNHEWGRRLHRMSVWKYLCFLREAGQIEHIGRETSGKWRLKNNDSTTQGLITFDYKHK